MGDIFAKIAEGYNVDLSRGLVCPQPIEIKDVTTKLNDGADEGFTPYKKISDKDGLENLLKDYRNAYAPFLKNLAPTTNKTETAVKITDFIYTDYQGNKSRVTVPHYGGPAQKCKVSYETDFTLEDFAGKCVYICFKGADYKAAVFVNGMLAGTHEGFFSPFSFDITELAKPGANSLKIILENDITQKDGGEKVYAATGLGWDDPETGWHHCPPGVGLYNDVSVEIRENVHITDIFPSFESAEGELWVECNSQNYEPVDTRLIYSIYGKNFSETVVENAVFEPTTEITAGYNDTLTAAKLKTQGRLNKPEPLYIMHGFNRFVIPFKFKNPRIWTPDEPYLYTVVVKLEVNGKVTSVKTRNFGIRSFRQDTENIPKGRFFLNGSEIKLRGANTMGFEQQDIKNGDFERLIDDILLAKICNMNFLRITQRPVQEEFYDYCDMLGMMIQTDFPLFGVIRINKVNECLRQVSEMERLVRSHPCCILDSYINEPFPNANNMPHRMINRSDMKNFFMMADCLVHMENPNRVIKHVDGDYDPPDELLPDNHCYTFWYNGHGIEAGKLHKGYWLGIKPDWCCGCGEFGSEGLEDSSVMRKYYPKEWLAEPFHPKNILRAQTSDFHGFFYETPDNMEDWIYRSQRHQAFATRIMTSAFRRNPLMNTFAIHLFIDAFPSGWMKSVMDCDRNPKKAFFEYMDCLSPVFCNLRSDRFTFFDNEQIEIEAYLCNDSGTDIDEIKYFVEMGGDVLCSASQSALEGMSQGKIAFSVPRLKERTAINVFMGAFSKGRLIHFAKEKYEVFPYEELNAPGFIDYSEYESDREYYDSFVKEGNTLYFSPLSEGEYKIAGKNLTVTACRMSPIYNLSRNTGHKWVADFKENDFSYMYDSNSDMLEPLIDATVADCGFTPVLTSVNRIDGEHFTPQIACGTYEFGKGKVVICQAKLNGKEKNPVAVHFLNSMSLG